LKKRRAKDFWRKRERRNDLWLKEIITVYCVVVKLVFTLGLGGDELRPYARNNGYVQR
jgi:hypothetical protein